MLGQKSSSPPVQSVEKFDPKKFIQAQQGTIDAQVDALPEIGRILGQTNRDQGVADLQQFVNLIQDPGDVIYASGISDARNRIKTNNQKLKSTKTGIADLKSQLANQETQSFTYKNNKGKTVTINRQEAQDRLKTLQGNRKTFQDKQNPLKNQLAKARRTAERFDINKAYDKAFPEISKAQDAFVKQLGQAAKPATEYTAFQKQLKRTLTPTQQYTTAQDYLTQATTKGTQKILENQAARELALGRSLTPEQEREAVQSARSGMAARGLGVGSAAAAAELLNRDRFATQREAERRQFASNVMNQGVNLRTGAADLAESERTRQLGVGEMRSNLSNAERLRQLGVGETLVNTTTAYDPRMRLLGVAQPNNQIAGLASQTGNAAAQIGASGYTFGINQNNSLYNNWQNNRTAQQVGQMGMIGSIGGGLLSAAGTLGGASILNQQ